MKTTAMKHSIICADGNWSLPAPRKYLDEFADEYKTTTIEEKINALGLFIHEGMNLAETVEKYMDCHSDFTVASLKYTLIAYIQKMRWNTTCNWTDMLMMQAGEIELAKLLQKELQLRYSNNGVVCSAWGEKEELEIIRRVNTDQEALKHMLMDIEFSKEKLLS